MTAGNLRTALGQGVPFRLSIVALGGNREHRRDAYDTLGLATCVTLRPSEKYHRRPACARNDGWKSANGSGARCAFRLSIVALGGNREHRRDAYDTLGLATCVTLRPSEKYHRRPACARNDGWKSANGSGARGVFQGFGR